MMTRRVHALGSLCILFGGHAELYGCHPPGMIRLQGQHNCICESAISHPNQVRQINHCCVRQQSRRWSIAALRACR